MNTFLSIFLSWLAYFALHSLLAAEPVKKVVNGWSPGFSRAYRLLYNGVALLLFYLLIRQLYLHPGNILWAENAWIASMGLLLCLTGTAILIATFRNYDISEFLGIREAPQTTGLGVLRTDGLNARVRHPLYLGTLICLAGYWVWWPTLHLLAIIGSVCVYLPLGIYWEEQKLLRYFGPAYQDYQRRVKRLIPRVW